MKKLLLAIGLFTGPQFGASAQTTYSFTATTGTYTDLVTPTVLTTAGWDDDDFTVAIGFPFTIFDPTGAGGNLTVDSVNIDTYGDLYFSSASDLKIVVGYEADLVDLGTTTTMSPVSYQLSGTAGSRIFKIEFKNVGFSGQSGPVTGDFANFQVWLYEGSNKIEMHYGPSSVSAASMSTFISGTGSSHGVAAHIDPTTGTVTGPFISGQPASPTMANATVPFNAGIGWWQWPSLTGVALNGAVYAFNPGTGTGLPSSLNHTTINMFPNPATDVLQIAGLQAEKGNLSIRVYDVLGKLVLDRQAAAAANIAVDLTSLNKGTYFVEIVSGTNRAGKQIIKQ
ncbi:MAG TPA: T9SS type A sorting domain-containing protein [Adhaeribacter sp.]|nr:T9SS type A sorting domain-containing protein [Adhaeribacter sp.]